MLTWSQWDKRIQPYFTSKMRIIGEVPLTSDDVSEIAALINERIQKLGLGEATRLLWGLYPKTLLAFMTLFSAYNTEHDYWGTLGSHLGVDRSRLFSHRFHQYFYGAIKETKLRVFDFDEKGTPYVATIRYHGGIPAHSLPDFFERMVQPSIERPAFRESPSKEVLVTLLKTVYAVDSPVITFLKYSGELGIEFFDACRTLARNYASTRQILSADDLGLPAYVVENYATFMEEAEDRKFHLRKPILLFSPTSYEANLCILLPGQEIPLHYADGSLYWEVTWPGGTLQQLRPRMRRQREDVVIDEIPMPIDATPTDISAALRYLPEDDPQASKILRRWNLVLMPKPAQIPLIAIRDAGQWIQPGRDLPAEELLLLYPKNMELSIEGSGRQTQVYGALSGIWHDWQVQGWDLHEAWAVTLLQNGIPVGLPLRVIGRVPEPELAGDPFSYNTDPQDIPLYIGQPPDLQIPLRSGRSVRDELAHWRIMLRPDMEACPQNESTFSLDEYQDNISAQDGYASLPLKILLGCEPAGKYSIDVRGPGDTHRQFRFRTWPKLFLNGFPKSILLCDSTAEPVRFTLTLPDHTRCEVQAGVTGTQVKLVGGVWEISLGPETVSADLQLVMDAANGGAVHVPICLPIPRLRWALSLEAKLGNLDWCTRPLSMSIDRLLQNGDSGLHVQMHGLGDFCSRCRLELVNSEDIDHPVQSADFKNTPFSPDWLRVSLGQLSDTLRHSREMMRLDFILPQSWDEPCLRVPLVMLNRKLEIDQVELTPIDDLNWILGWHEPNPLKNRRVLFEPAWQPWQECLEFHIPDNAVEYLLENVALQPSRYRIYFYIAYSWDPALTSPPNDVVPIIYDLCTPQDRLLQVSQKGATPDVTLELQCEAACIFNDLGEYDKRDEVLSRCAVTLNHVTNLRLLLGLFRWLDERKITGSIARYLWNRMFTPEIVFSLFSDYCQDDMFFVRYLSYLPRIKSIYAESALLVAQEYDDPPVVLACLR